MHGSQDIYMYLFNDNIIILLLLLLLLFFIVNFVDNPQLDAQISASFSRGPCPWRHQDGVLVFIRVSADFLLPRVTVHCSDRLSERQGIDENQARGKYIFDWGEGGQNHEGHISRSPLKSR